MGLTTLEQHAMLAIVALKSNAYGVLIQDHILRTAGYEPTVGGLYAALDRLGEKGFVKSKHGEASAQRGGRRRLYFSITAQGQRALSDSLKAVNALRRAAGWKKAPA